MYREQNFQHLLTVLAYSNASQTFPSHTVRDLVKQSFLGLLLRDSARWGGTQNFCIA
jgi:hypothetical protein